MDGKGRHLLLLPQPLQGIRAESSGARLGRPTSEGRAHPILQPLVGPHVDEAFRESRFTRYALLNARFLNCAEE